MRTLPRISQEDPVQEMPNRKDRLSHLFQTQWSAQVEAQSAPGSTSLSVERRLAGQPKSTATNVWPVLTQMSLVMSLEDAHLLRPGPQPTLLAPVSIPPQLGHSYPTVNPGAWAAHSILLRSVDETYSEKRRPMTTNALLVPTNPLLEFTKGHALTQSLRPVSLRPLQDPP